MAPLALVEQYMAIEGPIVLCIKMLREMVCKKVVIESEWQRE
jgi:hypothetical protein